MVANSTYPTDRIAELRRALVHALVATGIGPEAHDLLPTLLAWEHGVTRGEAERLIAWFLEHAEPGDAGLAADIFERVQHLHRRVEHPWVAEVTRPLATWLVTKGSGELRSRRRGTLAVRVAEAVWEQTQDPTVLGQCIRLILANEVPLGANAMFPNDMCAFMSLVEHAAGATDDELVVDVAVSAFGKWGETIAASVIDPPEGWPDLPRCRLGLLVAAARGRLPRAIASAAWRAAFWQQMPSELPRKITTVEAVDTAIAELHEHAAFKFRHMQSEDGKRGPDAAEWAGLVAAEHIRIHELTMPASKQNAQLAALTRCVGSDPVIDGGVARALRAALQRGARGKPAELALAILERDQALGSVKAAIKLLEELEPTPHDVARVHVDVGGLLSSMLHHPWTHTIAGVDMSQLLEGVSSVQLESLEGDDKVRIEGSVLFVDGPSIQSAIDVPLPNDEQRALAALYVVHELVHLQQAVGEKKVVAQMRATGLGGETNLMHVDLGADHASACIVSEVFPRWHTLWLKNLQGRSLMAFPASRHHGSSSRFRKAIRLVGLRVDYLTRKLALVDPRLLETGYAFADFAPAGGQFVALVSGPPFRVLGSTPMSSEDGATLQRSIEPAESADGLANVDEVLQRLLLEAI